MSKIFTNRIKIGGKYKLPETFECFARSPDGTMYKMWVNGLPIVEARCEDDGLLYFVWNSTMGCVHLFCSSVDEVEEVEQ